MHQHMYTHTQINIKTFLNCMRMNVLPACMYVYLVAAKARRGHWSSLDLELYTGTSCVGVGN